MNRLEGMLAGSSRVQSVSPELGPSHLDDIIVDINLDDCLSAPYPVCGCLASPRADKLFG